MDESLETWNEVETSNWSEEENQNIEKSINLEEIERVKNTLILEIQKAEHTINLLNSLVENWKINETLFESIRKEIEKSHDEIKGTKSINTKFYNDLLDQEKKVKETIETVRSFLSDAKTLKNNILWIETEFIKNRAKLLETKKDIEKIKNESKELKDKIKAELKITQTIWKESDKIIEELRKWKILADWRVKYIKWINEEAQKNQKEILLLLSQGKESFKKIKDTEKDINSIYVKADKNTGNILSWHEKIFNPWGIKDKIKEIDRKIKDNQIQIDNQLSQASWNRLVIHFKNKLDKTERSLNARRKRTIWIAICLTLISIWIYIISSINSNFKIDIWKYIELIYPTIFLLIFSTLQYSRTNKFYEEYYFKYISAFGLPAYFELLESKNEDKAIKYLIETIEKIHNNPTNEINKNSKDNLFDYVLDRSKWLMWAKKNDLNKVLKDITKEQIGEARDFLQNKFLK